MSTQSHKRPRTFEELQDYVRNRLHAIVTSVHHAEDLLKRSLESVDSMFQELPDLFEEEEIRGKK